MVSPYSPLIPIPNCGMIADHDLAPRHFTPLGHSTCDHIPDILQFIPPCLNNHIFWQL